MKARGDADFSHALTDLMSGVAVTFLLIAAIFMVHSGRDRKRAVAAQKEATQAAQHNKRSADELARLKAQDTSGIDALRALMAKLEPMHGRVEVDYEPAEDPRLLAIVFNRDYLRFDSAACELGAAQDKMLVATLQELLPLVCATVDAGVVQSIALEGHTDNEPAFGGRCGVHAAERVCGHPPYSPACLDQFFENNVKLSTARAHHVFFQARKALHGNAALSDCLEHNFVVAGRGPVDPVDHRPWRTHRDAAENERNRRVVVKVRVQTAVVSR